MIDVLFFDDRGGFSPSYIRGRPVGGSEMHQHQLAAWLVAQGQDVLVAHRGPASVEDGVQYEPATSPYGRVGNLVVIGCASPPRVEALQTFALQVVDPRPHPHLWDHLKGRAKMVCVSEWQAGLFRAIGHEAIVIPVPIPDEWYGLARARLRDSVCVSSWNKGAQATLDAWHPSMGHLSVGSPYSQPEDAEARCHAVGAWWLGALTPRERWIDALATASAMARVCTIGETFGVADVAARAMGIPSYTLCTGDVGALREVGAAPFTDPAAWREAIRQRHPHPGGDAERYRLSRVLPQWLEILK